MRFFYGGEYSLPISHNGGASNPQPRALLVYFTSQSAGFPVGTLFVKSVLIYIIQEVEGLILILSVGACCVVLMPRSPWL